VYEKGQAGAATSVFHPNSSTFLLALPPFSLSWEMGSLSFSILETVCTPTV